MHNGARIGYWTNWFCEFGFMKISPTSDQPDQVINGSLRVNLKSSAGAFARNCIAILFKLSTWKLRTEFPKWGFHVLGTRKIIESSIFPRSFLNRSREVCFVLLSGRIIGFRTKSELDRRCLVQSILFVSVWRADNSFFFRTLWKPLRNTCW